MERFRLGGVPGVTPAKWMRVWAQRVPEVPIELVPLDESDAIAALHDDRADAVLARLPIEAEGMHRVPLYDELAVVVAAVGHPIVAFETVTLADLEGEQLLESGDLSPAQLLEVVATGVGLAIVPMSVARALGGPNTRHRVVTDAPTTTIALVWPERADSALHQELIGIAKGRRAASSRGREREHRVEPGNAATGAKPRPSKPKPSPAQRPRKRGGHGRGGRPGPGGRR